jgi:hypothetical protein
LYDRELRVCPYGLQVIAAFRSKLTVEADVWPYLLVTPLVYDSALLNRTLIVPVGFETDLASVPRPLWNILPPFGSYSSAAVVHDFLYKFNGVTRQQADAVLNEAMQVQKVGHWTRWTIWAGVRAGGWKPWNAYRAEETQPL